MALDLIGIENVEFYSGHYLDAVLEGDLKLVFDSWRQEHDEKGARLPWDSLNSLADSYFKMVAAAEGERDEVERWQVVRDFHAHLIAALGYERRPADEVLDGNVVCPVLLSLQRSGNPFLWIVEAPFAAESDDDPMAATPLREQLQDDEESVELPRGEADSVASWSEIFGKRLFQLDHAPRWVIFLAGREVVLVERNKWPQGRLLRFDLGELFSRRQGKALRAMAGLLHRDVLAPETGLCLHDTLDESSHKHAFAVSGDLKHGVRRAVELLANEAVYYRREVQRLGVFNEDELAPKLTSECLTYLYRLLFLFYVEARGGELGVVPMKSDAYRQGYSLETLRDLELVPLATEQSRNGYFLQDSLRTLFRILNDGFPEDAGQSRMLAIDDLHHDTFEIAALNSPLFDDTRLEILKGVRFRNQVVQEVLQLLSLSAEKKSKKRGRISYAQLGINQLGAVYEGLLSYTGFFAAEDLYEVASEKDCKALSGKPAAEREALKTYFVPASKIGDYKDTEIVKDENGKKVVHPKGAFIFRLSGRNREKSASYYTPEVLTRCLVKYALKELLWEEAGEGEKPKRKKTADEILALTICEPAMGSSAFLIEAVDQLADAYLEARQEERGEQIAPEQYQYEKRRVKARLATNNCYGVDLNPTAVELAKVSLWLATMYEGEKCPWFGLRLATGNSLVGARREVFKTADVTRKGTKKNPNWLGLAPEKVPLYHGPDGPPIDEHWMPPSRPKGTIYHFLLPAEGMAAFNKDKVIKEIAPESVKHIKQWRKEFCAKFGKTDAERLERLSDAVDRLFAQVVRERVLATSETSDRIPVWGEEVGEEKQGRLLVRDQERVQAALESNSSAFRRLELVMDAWCALWFWPIDRAYLLPDRASWIAQLELILVGDVTNEVLWEQTEMFPDLTRKLQAELPLRKKVAGAVDVSVSTEEEEQTSSGRLRRLREIADSLRERRAGYAEECGVADVVAILGADEALGTAREVAGRLRFHHWDLRFAEVLASRGGFDLSLGNPPWVKLQWQEGGVLSDYEPLLEIRSVSASEIAKRRAEQLADDVALHAYLAEFVEMDGVQNYLNSHQNYPLLKRVQTNSYKCFLTRGWNIGSGEGVLAYLHPEGVYDDPKGGVLRRALYPRLGHHYQFINEGHLFAEVHNLTKYSMNVYRSVRADPVFQHMSNLFHPRTIDASWEHDGRGPVPGIKDEADEFDATGHRNRLIAVRREQLALFASLYDKPKTPALEARLPVVHSREIVRVLGRFADQPRKLGDIKDQCFTTVMFDETYAQRDGTIRRETRYPKDVSEWILQGPHFYVGNPFNKTPNEGCSSNRDYTSIDLTAIPDDYLPRTNYVPACEPAEYARRIPKWKGRPVTEFYRHVHREMVGPTAERTLISSVAPPGCAHINTVFGVAFATCSTLLFFSGLLTSIPIDFFIRSTGKGHVNDSLIARVPFPESREFEGAILRRALSLYCLTETYRDLWDAQVEVAPSRLTVVDPRADWRHQAESLWSRNSAVRNDLTRRQVLLELDVLSSLALGLSIEELVAIYRVQFPIVQQYERERLHDQHGRIVPIHKTASGNPAVNLVEVASILKEQVGFDAHAEYYPDESSTLELMRQKVRLGKREADVLGVPERCTMADLLAETEVCWSDEDHPEGRPVRLMGLRYTDPGLEPRMERVYPTPWTRCDREADYRQAWAEFERRLGKKMPGGTPL